MSQAIKLRRVNKTNIINLAFLLNNDSILYKSLKSVKPMHTLTGGELLADLKKWQADNSAASYAILLDGKSIGLMSLSHQKGSCAQVGYWIASQEWNKGYATKAFEEIIRIAKSRGFKKLSATIEVNNIDSQRIWEKFGADFIEHDDKFNASINI